MTDDTLILEYITKRSEEAFAEIVQRHTKMVLRTCLDVVKTQQDAEDAMQVTFLILAKQTTAKTPLANWLHGVARRVSFQTVRARTRRARHEKGAGKMEAINPPERLGELREAVDKAITLLTAKCQEAVILKYLEGWTHEEAAQIVGCPVKTFGTRLYKGLEELREIVERRTNKVISASVLLFLLEQDLVIATPVSVKALQLKALLGLEPTNQIVVFAQRHLRSIFWAKVRMRALGGVVLLTVAGATAGLAASRYFRPNAPPLQTVSQQRHLAVPPTALANQPAKKKTFTPSPVDQPSNDFTAISPTGKTKAVGYADGRVELYDWLSDRKVASLPHLAIDVTCVVFSPKANKLAWGHSKGQLKTFDLASKKELAGWRGHGRMITCLAFSPDGRTLLSADDGSALLRSWEADSGKPLKTYSAGHVGTLNCVKFSPDGSRFATGGSDGSVKMWQLSTGQELTLLPPNDRQVWSVDFSPDGRWLAAGAMGAVNVWDVATRKKLTPFPYVPTGPTEANLNSEVLFSPNGKFLACMNYYFSTIDRPGFVRLWDLDTKRDRVIPRTALDRVHIYWKLAQGGWDDAVVTAPSQ